MPSQNSSERLAIDGGKPVRTKPFPPAYPGAAVMGSEEAELADRVIRAQSPFRFYGINQQDTVQTLEEMMAKDLGIPYALGVTSGTGALMVALKALGIGYGDKVVVPSVTFIATATAVICCNAVPVFCDVDESLNLDPNDLERVCDEEVKAIIVVPILGVACDMDGVMAFARKRGIPVLEDVAQSCGVRWKGQYAGTIGDIGAFSFQQNKILTAGEGGAVVTGDKNLFERAVRFHDQGMYRPAFAARHGAPAPDETAAFAGQNYRMSEITGAVLVAQWRKLDMVTSCMRSHCRAIREAMSRQIPGIKFRTLPDPDGEIGSTLGMILPSAEAAQRFTQATAAEGIPTMVLYGGKPAYTNPAIFHQRSADGRGFPFNYPFKKSVSYTLGMCPRAEDLLPRTVFLQISPVLTKEDAEEAVAGLVKVFKGLNLA